MVVASLGPGKFYGSSLPRPRIYPDVKLNPYRVDPPVSVTDSLISWAEEAHWSKGGSTFNRHRHRLQGRIEGNIDNLKNQIEEEPFNENKSLTLSPAAPDAPIAKKRKRRYVGLVDDDDDDDDVEEGVKEWPVRKLYDEFELVVSNDNNKKSMGVDIEATVALRTRGRKIVSREEGVTVGSKRLRKVGDDTL